MSYRYETEKQIPPSIHYACLQSSCHESYSMWSPVEWVDKEQGRPTKRWNAWHKKQSEFQGTSEMVVGGWLVLVGWSHD